MTSVKAALSVILKANEVVVAEVEDAILWQQILTAIQSGKSNLQEVPNPENLSNRPPSDNADQIKSGNVSRPGSSPLDSLAAQLGIDRALVEGACSPTADPPYMHLNAHCWEEMKKQLPGRGKTAIAPIVAAVTMLLLWFQKAELGNPTQSNAQAVLATISLSDPNASRSIGNADWLQLRPGQVVLNPAEISKAVKLMKCFCMKDWTIWKETTSS